MLRHCAVLASLLALGVAAAGGRLRAAGSLHAFGRQQGLHVRLTDHSVPQEGDGRGDGGGDGGDDGGGGLGCSIRKGGDYFGYDLHPNGMIKNSEKIDTFCGSTS